MSTLPGLLSASGMAEVRLLLPRLIGGLFLFALTLFIVWGTVRTIRLKDNIKAKTGPARLRTQLRAGTNSGIVREEYYVSVGDYEFEVNEHEYAVFIEGEQYAIYLWSGQIKPFSIELLGSN